MDNLMVCTPRHLPVDKIVAAAATAVKINPHNHVALHPLTRLLPDFAPTKERIALVTKKYWGIQGVRLRVSFMDNPPAALRKRILQHMNAWSKTANVHFVQSSSTPQIRIARVDGTDGGYWSYVGTDVLHIKAKDQTMNLEGFTMNTPESEFHRVVRHETGHTLGFPHEHMRKALVAKLDVKKTLAYFEQTQGWSEAEVRAQVLTPLEESSLLGTTPDPKSIMCYQIPGQLTKNGKAISGGNDISPLDYSFVSTIYPKAKAKTASAK
jgi:Astacin (Peptidase family M12A)